MSKRATDPQILTANRLIDGRVVYWQGAGWAESLAEAEIFDDPEAADAALKGAQQWVAERVVVGTYLFAVRLDEGVAVPVKARELIRAAGPSVRRDLGKQAEGLFSPPPVHAQVRHARTTPGPARDPFDVSI
ncbi:MAG: DUF2849 domain-containing protein [Alphaproteobacteria bacterium]|nr:DUF2849 domain-containing protein [Alphaproteobacteria bacterium]